MTTGPGVFYGRVRVAKDHLLSDLADGMMRVSSLHLAAQVSIGDLEDPALLSTIHAEALLAHPHKMLLENWWSREPQHAVYQVRAMVRSMITRALMDDADVIAALDEAKFKVSKATGDLTFPPN